MRARTCVITLLALTTIIAGCGTTPDRHAKGSAAAMPEPWSPTGTAPGPCTPAPMGATSRPPEGSCSTVPPHASLGPQKSRSDFGDPVPDMLRMSRGEAKRLGAMAGLVWPQPPQPARIRFTRAVARPRDVGLQPSWWGRLGQLLIGAAEEWFIRPTGVAAQGTTLYVADPGAQSLWMLDSGAHRCRRIRMAGTRALVSPVAVAIGREGRVYLADSYLAAILVYDARGRLMTTVSGPDLRRPCGVAYDALSDQLYVADSAAHRVWVFTGDGAPRGRIGRRGIGPGEFNFPTHVAVDRTGIVYVTDSLGFRVQFFLPDGTYAGGFGRHGDLSGDFAMPKGVAVDRGGHIYVVDALFDAVQIFDHEGHFLLSFGGQGTQPGQLWLPGGLCIDSQDRIYVADAYNHRVQIFEYVGGQGDS